MANSGQHNYDDMASSGNFANIKFEPNGCGPFHFPNGVQAVSSKYLEEVSMELYEQGELGNKKPRLHKDIIGKIRDFMSDLEFGGNFRRTLNHSYYHMQEDTYTSDNNRQNATHIWMSPDLCLAIAASEHRVIQACVIDDLNRLQQLLQVHADRQLPNPSLQAYLPGTIADHYREKQLVEISTGRLNGYYPMAQVKQMYCDQNQATMEEFDNKYPWKALYNELYSLTVHMDERTLSTVSHVGKGTTTLFHVSVLEKYFREIDFKNL